MGKKKNSTGLGNALIKNRFAGHQRNNDKSMRHTADLDDGYDWGRLNLQSVTEQSNLDEFLATAELAGTEFEAEKLNIQFVNPKGRPGILTEEEKKQIHETQDAHRKFLQIPRRPPWNERTTADELESNEREAFLTWRRQLAELQEVEGIILTPYERNLEFWRQLWRVVERSDVVCQIVDARNPLLFWCEDLDKYVKEISDQKMNLLIVNKADFLTHKQRLSWAAYFTSINKRVVFFSALCELLHLENLLRQEKSAAAASRSREDINRLSDALNVKLSQFDNEDAKESSSDSDSEEDGDSVDEPPVKSDSDLLNDGCLLSRDELVEYLRGVHKDERIVDGRVTVGMVGYPNVGKSSIINCLLQYKKVSVSATPGKTKHFQTLYIDSDVMLCDCPGLVMPTFVSTKADMVISGILPIDQMRDYISPVNLVGFHIPRHVLQDVYGILLPKPLEGEDPNRPPHADEILNAYGYMRGFMTVRGIPDTARSSRYILKDYVCGKLKYCHAPPGVDQSEFHQFCETKRQSHQTGVRVPSKLEFSKPSSKNVDQDFFHHQNSEAHSKGSLGVSGYTRKIGFTGHHGTENNIENSNVESSRKRVKKFKKREKLRRVYAHLDS